VRLTAIVMTGGLLAALATAPALADEIARARQDLRQDRREIRGTTGTSARTAASCGATGPSCGAIGAPATPTS